jgi:hypothetical protein
MGISAPSARPPAEPQRRRPRQALPRARRGGRRGLRVQTLVLDAEAAIFDDQLRSPFELLRYRRPDVAATPPLLMAFDVCSRSTVSVRNTAASYSRGDQVIERALMPFLPTWPRLELPQAPEHAHQDGREAGGAGVPTPAIQMMQQARLRAPARGPAARLTATESEGNWLRIRQWVNRI